VSVEVALADPVFPQLGIAGDPESMCEVFQEHLRPLGETTYHVLDCRLSRIRYRKGVRCVLQYILRLAEVGTGHERIQWVTGVMYAEDATRRKWEKLRLLDPMTIPEAFSTFEPFSFIPGLGMLVEVFPYDRRLPTLPLLMGGTVTRTRALAPRAVRAGRLARRGMERRTAQIPGRTRGHLTVHGAGAGRHDRPHRREVLLRESLQRRGGGKDLPVASSAEKQRRRGWRDVYGGEAHRLPE
jgi:hypothetical protein